MPYQALPPTRTYLLLPPKLTLPPYKSRFWFAVLAPKKSDHPCSPLPLAKLSPLTTTTLIALCLILKAQLGVLLALADELELAGWEDVGEGVVDALAVDAWRGADAHAVVAGVDC